MSIQSTILKELAYSPKNAKELRVRVKADSKKIAKALKRLVKDGKVKEDRGLYFLPSQQKGGIEGRLVKLGKTFGFVTPDDASGDIFVPGRSLKGAVPGDKVLVSLFKHPRVEGSREGEVLSILEENRRVVGTVEMVGGKLALIPDNAHDTPLFIKKNADGGAKPGEKAAGEIIERADHHDKHRVGITLRFGSADSARQCAKAIVFGAGIEKRFPESVKLAAKKVSEETIDEAALQGRKDFRGEVIFTIDSATTKDIDDAISIKKTKNGYQLGVHIADVSHYVTPKSELDQEALKRGTSLYYADVVIPMLPKALSNGICSLNPNEERLAFSCLMELDSSGRLTSYTFHKAVIKSCLQGVYSEINSILAGNAELEIQEKYSYVHDSITVMNELYEKLAALRKTRGSLEIESEEARLLLDEEGRCVGIEKRERGVSERMIEEFMLLANSSAAHLAKQLDIPFVYRVHDKPGMEKVEQLKTMLDGMGISYDFKGEAPTQQEFAELLDKTRGTNLSLPVHSAVLRSMAKAKYEPLPKGHYGLALEDYAHFTSPIRRYPDLAIHRILGDVVAGAGLEELRKKYKNFANLASEASSATELVAQRVERDCDDCYKAEYMGQFIGECFDGVISAVLQFGVYVMLSNSAEGLIHISNLGTGNLKLVEGISLTDPVTGMAYRIGSPIRVLVSGVDVSQGTVDFVPAPAEKA